MRIDLTFPVHLPDGTLIRTVFVRTFDATDIEAAEPGWAASDAPWPDDIGPAAIALVARVTNMSIEVIDALDLADLIEILSATRRLAQQRFTQR